MKKLILISLMLVGGLTQAQSDRSFIREGNKKFQAAGDDTTKLNGAKYEYFNSLNKNSNSAEANYNLGDVYYKQGHYDSAVSRFQNASGLTTDKEKLAKAYHNLGNSLLRDKKYEESIDAFKNSLKNMPKDDETKYNLAYAQSMLRQQQKQQQQNKDNKDQKKDKKEQDKKDQQKQGDKKDDKKDQQQKEQQAKEEKDKKGDKDQKQAQPKDQKKMSKEEAERMLQALNNQEKDLQKKLGKKIPVNGVLIDKDW